MYELAALEDSLAGTIFAGKLHYAPTTRSTQFDALAAARRGALHGSVFFADEQTAGRGRGDHSWLSTPGDGLYVSVLLRYAAVPEHVQLLPLAIGLATVRAMRQVSGIDIDLRWPNDLLIGPLKAGGILGSARRLSVGRPHPPHLYVVAGIGINVHQRSFPADLATPATSLDLATGRHVSRQALLIALLRAIEQEGPPVADSEFAKRIPSRIEAASSWACGRRVEVHGPQACVGTTAGLDANGSLLVETADGIVTVQTGGIREAAFSC